MASRKVTNENYVQWLVGVWQSEKIKNVWYWHGSKKIILLQGRDNKQKHQFWVNANREVSNSKGFWKGKVFHLNYWTVNCDLECCRGLSWVSPLFKSELVPSLGTPGLPPMCAEMSSSHKSEELPNKTQVRDKTDLGRVDVAHLRRGDTVTQSGWGLTLLARLTRAMTYKSPG